MGKKRFINKGDGKKFYLLHRSQTDAAYAGEENPSDFVLVEQKRISYSATNNVDDEPSVNSKSLKDLFRLGNHVTTDGFINDGYDYSKHFKEMGGGKFIGVDGSERETPITSRVVELPSELLPTGEELERNLEAVVISEKYMDEDIRNALFQDEDEYGAFEELDDDFVLQAMAEPEVLDFDFDAHIAKLIASSQRDSQYIPGRPWDINEKAKELIDSNDEYDEYDDDESEEYDDDDKMTETVQKVSSEQQAFVEAQFEKTLHEYDDDEIGDLGEADEVEIEGYINLEQSNKALEDALDDFLKTQEEDRKYEKPIVENLDKTEDKSMDEIRKKMVGLQLVHENQSDEDDNPMETMDPKIILKDSNRRHQELLDQIRKQEEAQEIIDEVEEMVAKQTQDEVWNCQKYLSTEKVMNQWDCETILSTYSTLDNHPTTIKDENSNFRPHKSRFVRSNEEADEQRRINIKRNEDKLNHPNHQAIGEVIGNNNNTNNRNNSISIKPIILSSKNNLPIGYGLSGKIIEEKSITSDDSDEGKEEMEGIDSIEDGKIKIKNLVRLKNETSEEKKARKQLAKQEKRQKRILKKEIKAVYKEEASKQIHHFANQQDIHHAHVFKTVS